MSLIDSIKTDVEKASHAFSDERTGLYLPKYQREYTWEKEQYVRLLNDITEYFNQSSSASIGRFHHFLGAAIYLIDRDKEYIYPNNIPNYPDTILNLIDGQQRLTTLSLISMQLIESLQENSSILNLIDINQAQKRRLEDLNMRLQETLKSSFMLELKNYEKAPKIIRSQNDIWSQQYKSPLASYTWKFMVEHNYVNDNKSIDQSVSSIGENKLFCSSLKLLSNLVDTFITQKPSLLTKTKLKKLNDLEDLVSKRDSKYHILEDSSFDFVADIADNKMKQKYQEFVRTIFLASFINNCLLTVNFKIDRDYESAVSIFDSLNSAGKQLTPLECLKPAVIASAKEDENGDMSKLETNQKVKTYLEIEEVILDITQKRKTKTSVEKTIVTIFSLILSGTKLGNELAEQRAELVDRFVEMKKRDEYDHQLEYLRLLKCVAEVYLVFYVNKPFTFKTLITSMIDEKLEDLSDESNVCMNYLKDSKCHLGLAPIARYFYEARYQDENLIEPFKAMCKVAQATAAFFAFWQTSGNISDRKEEVFRGLFPGDMYDPEKDFIDATFYDYGLHELKRLPQCELVNIFYSKKVNDKMDIEEEECAKLEDIWLENVADFPLFDHTISSSRLFLLIDEQLDAMTSLANQDRVDFQYVPPALPEFLYYIPRIYYAEHIIPRAITKKYEDCEQLWNNTLYPKDLFSELRKLISKKESMKKAWEILLTVSDKEYAEILATMNQNDEETNGYTEDDRIMMIACKLRSYYIERGLIDMIHEVGKFNLEKFNSGDEVQKAQNRAKYIYQLCWKKLGDQWLDYDIYKSYVYGKLKGNDDSSSN